jgi:sphinganine-1-phosphate aldolase
MYYVSTDWCGGIYATPSFPGSRSGFASAGAWYALTHIGKSNFVSNAIAVSDATKSAAAELRKIKGV